MAKKWEYLVKDLNSREDGRYESSAEEQQAYFNGLGNDGWELVAVTPTVTSGGGLWTHQKAYFKREKA